MKEGEGKEGEEKEKNVREEEVGIYIALLSTDASQPPIQTHTHTNGNACHARNQSAEKGGAERMGWE